MISFKTIDINDKVWIDTLLSYNDFRGTEYCFTSLFAWSNIYNSSVARFEDRLLVRSLDQDKVYYLFPAGRGDLKKCIELLLQDALQIGKVFVMNGIPSSQTHYFEELFPGLFELSPVRNSFDYIYDREALASLKGKKYQPKRNHIARFRELSGWKYETISYENPDLCLRQIEECKRMNQEWCLEHKCKNDNSLSDETCFVKKTLNHFVELQLRGGILRLDGKVIAYTIGEPLNSDTFIIHIEKAFQINGAYPMINQCFVQNETINFKYINREDDAGVEGLRSAKLSYHPAFMEEKYCAIKK